MIAALNRHFRRLRKDEKGATAIEYGLIAALISVAIITGATALGGQLGTTFTNLKDCLSKPSACSYNTTTPAPGGDDSTT